VKGIAVNYCYLLNELFRWCHVLDISNKPAKDWTAKEDELLHYGLQIFGKGK
jgi:hypothetical protein